MRNARQACAPGERLRSMLGEPQHKRRALKREFKRRV